MNSTNDQIMTLSLTNSELFSLIMSLKNHRFQIKEMIENPSHYDSA